MTPDVVRVLACPVCGGALSIGGTALRCESGHSFDVARHGYVNLAAGGGRPATGDTAVMVAARSRFLDAGHFAPLTDAVIAEVAAVLGQSERAVVVDLGAGTGHHLTAVLDALPSVTGLALDASRYAARIAARAHPRAGAVVCDIWRALPVQSSAVDVVLDIFAPRNAAEIVRVLRPGGTLIVVTPAPDHLSEVVAPLGLLRVDPDKEQRLERDLGALTLKRQRDVRFSMTLAHDDVAAMAWMGPAAHHLDGEWLTQTVAALPDPIAVTGAVVVSVYTAPPSTS